MNQILFTYDYPKKLNSHQENILFKNKKKIYLFIFIFLIINIFIILCYIIYNKYSIYQKNLETSKMMDTYRLSTLYTSDSNYESIKLSNNISIIGLIEIPKIKISYPILSESNEDLLKISVCRFSRSSAK